MIKIVRILIIFIFLGINMANAKIIRDICNREVKIPEKVNKILALGPGALRFITYFNEQNKLCGVERIEFKLQNDFRPYFYVVKNHIRNLPIISEGGPGKMPYFSKLIITSPDVIISVGFSKTQADFISKKTNIPVILLDYGALGRINEKFFNSIEILGKVFNKEKRAENLINYIQNLEKDLAKRTKNIKKKSVFVGGIAYKGIHGFESTETDLLYLDLINAINIANFSKVKGHIDFSLESILKYNPEYIFIDVTGINLIKKQIRENWEIFKQLKAFQNRNVYKILPYNYYNSNASLVFVSAYYCGKILYPEKFMDIDLSKKAEEIFYNFFNVKFKKEDIDLILAPLSNKTIFY